MARRYAMTFTGQTVAAASGDVDLFYIAPADDKPCRLLGLWLAVTSETGDAAEEILRIDIVRGHSTVGSGGSSFTPLTLDASGQAAGFTGRILDTTIASAGTGATLFALGFNVRAGLEWIPTPEMVPEVSQANGVTLVARLMAAVADDVTMSGTAIVEELG